ncbi:hypothetical protein QQS21_007331 [Conoideocrella luteorostrata]|uniref:Transcription factor domain-containing protein n=1 Tax=Conoideocrella luteorostrata TaxID=1105319 RepID=A0AAJ0FXH5_9HYPO|nr:hypothetical protein QQS21_007331 [Conoideocrella luteorostrata]
MSQRERTPYNDDDESYAPPVRRAQQACDNCRLSFGQPQLPNDVRMQGIALYFEHFHNLPYPLMARMSKCPPRSVDEFPPAIVWYPMLALTLRTAKHPFLELLGPGGERQRDFILSDLSEAAWRLVTQAYASMDVDVHYFQGLCLLAQVDFAEGRTRRAQAQVAIGIRLAQALGMLASETTSTLSTSDCTSAADHCAIVWTLFMLDRVFTGRIVSTPTLPASSYQLFLPGDGLWLPGSTISAEPRPTTLNAYTRDRRGHASGILSSNIELLHIWGHVVATSFQAATTDDKSTPFWKDGSPMSRAISAFLEFELKFHPHRYSSVGPPERVLTEPGLRPYFAPWSFAQICSSAIHCLLHHPFIIFIKARNTGDGVPLTCLQKSYRIAVIHSTWVLRLISEMEGAGVAIHDPFIGYQVAIAATIQLELTVGSKRLKVAQIARQRFRDACSFISRLSAEWPSMCNMISILEKLSVRIKHRQTISLVESEYDGAIPGEDTTPAAVQQEDIDLFWTLLDYTSISSYVCNKTDSQTAVGSLQPQRLESAALPSLAEQGTIESDGSATLASEQSHLSHHDPLNQQGLNWNLDPWLDGNWSFLGRSWEAYMSMDDLFAPM